MANTIAPVSGPTVSSFKGQSVNRTIPLNPQFPFGAGLAQQNTPGVDPVLAAVGVNQPVGMTPGNINAANPPSQV